MNPWQWLKEKTMAKSKPEKPAVLVPDPPGSDTPTAEYPTGEPGYKIGVDPSSETPVAVVVKPAEAVKVVPAGPHPLEAENAKLKARVAFLETVLRDSVAHGLNYTRVAEALKG